MPARKPDRDPVRGFTGEFSFLSNFHEIPSWQSGPLWATFYRTSGSVRVRTVEHAYQAAKCADSDDFDMIVRAATPAIARKLGRGVRLRPGWNDEARVQEMTMRVRAKFTVRVLARLLADTDGRELVESNTWGDTFWGVDARTGKGENRLGLILMDVRDEILGEQ